jgi:hypothetical protein
MKVMLKNSLIVLFSLMFCSNLFAKDAGQYMPGMMTDKEADDLWLEKEKNVEVNTRYNQPTETVEENPKKSPLLQGQELEDVTNVKTSDKSTTKSSLAAIAGSGSQTEFMELNADDINFKRRNAAHWNFSFSYLKDNFDYKDPNGIYQKTFKESTGSTQAGYLMFSSDYFLTRKLIDTTIGINAGFGYQKGKGYFTGTYNESDTIFQLWTIPIDLSAGVEIPFSGFLKASASAGPSIMGLLQTRNDKEKGEGYKRRRQVSAGYFYEGKFQISLTDFFPKYGYSMFKDYDITKAFFDIQARYQSYANFQNDIEISGASFGLGFTFEYL